MAESGQSNLGFTLLSCHKQILYKEPSTISVNLGQKRKGGEVSQGAPTGHSCLIPTPLDYSAEEGRKEVFKCLGSICCLNSCSPSQPGKRQQARSDLLAICWTTLHLK